MTATVRSVRPGGNTHRRHQDFWDGFSAVFDLAPEPLNYLKMIQLNRNRNKALLDMFIEDKQNLSKDCRRVMDKFRVSK